MINTDLHDTKVSQNTWLQDVPVSLRIESKLPRPRFSRATAFVLAFLVATAGAFAQDQGDTTSSYEEDLFSEELVDVATGEKEGAGVSDILTSKSVRIGGRFTGKAGLSFTWKDPWNALFKVFDPDSSAPSLSLASLLYFDARPAEDFRIYGSAKVTWPFSNQVTVLTGAQITDPLDGSPYPVGISTDTVTLNLPNISVFELFSDFSWNDRLYFRFGKSTVKWGTGYFWSPADVINVGAIDMLDPTAQREGPVNFRLTVPIPGSQHNIYAYAILKSEDPAKPLPVAFSDIAFAGKAEFFLKPFEVGIGGFYQYDKPVRGMLTVAGPLWDFDLFGELSVASGSEKVFVTDINVSVGPPPSFAITRTTYPDSLFVSGTAGFMYNNQKADFLAVGQYFFNAEGYEDSVRNRITDTIVPIIDFIPDETAATKLRYWLASLAYGSGKHYAGAALTKSGMFDDKLSASVLAIANLSDLSGLVRPALTWKFFDYLSMEASLNFMFGSAKSEYGILGNPVTFGLSASLGTGSF